MSIAAFEQKLLIKHLYFGYKSPGEYFGAFLLSETGELGERTL
jgi:hypothetical protein